MAATFFANPFTVAVAVLVAVASSAIYYSTTKSPLVSRSRLAWAYLMVVVASVVLSAVAAYVPPEEASAVWHVRPEHYWQAIFDSFVLIAILTSCVALVGVAIVGFPIVVFLAKIHRATTQNVLASSLIVSAALATILTANDGLEPFRHFAHTVAYFAGTHLVLASAFCLGLGLPWRKSCVAHEA